jgi:hypothetical protein
MKTYTGKRSPTGEVDIRVDGKPLRQIVRHSPTGMEWGYPGSGPADTALSIMSDFFEGNMELADAFYFQFKWDFVAKWGNEWKVTDEEIDEWLKKLERR